MRTIIKPGLSLLLLLHIWVGFAVASSRNQKNTYADTKALLRKMDRHHPNRAFRKLFEEGNRRMADLITALDDGERDVRMNAQAIINYLAAPEGLSAIDEWIQRQLEQYPSYEIPGIELFHNPPLLAGGGNGLAYLVMKNRALLGAGKSRSENIPAEVLCYNKTLKVALIEIVIGQTFTEGWHVVIRKESDGWHLISDNLIWES
jgi:hypothetical protein